MALTIADFALLPDFEKLITIDWELARKLEEETWTATGGGSYWLSFTDGEVHEVKIDNILLVETHGMGECDAMPGSFYYDILNKNLFVHTTAGDSPAVLSGGKPKYSVVTFFVIGFANKQISLQRYAEQLSNGNLDQWTNSTTPEVWTKQIVGTGTVAREGTVVYDLMSAYSARLTCGAASSYVSIYESIYLRPSKKAMIRLKYKNVGSTILKIIFKDSGNNVWLKADGTWNVGSEIKINLPNSVTWTEYKIEFNAHTGYMDYRLYIIVDTNGDESYVDNVEVKRFYETMFYYPFLNENSIPSISHSVGNWHEPEEQISFGRVSFIDDGFFTNRFHSWLWNNKNFYLKLGKTSSIYDDLAWLFSGVSRTPEISDGKFSIDVKDARIELKKIPIEHFNSTNHPNCEETWMGKPIPILLGEKFNITPPCCDTVGHSYLVSHTVFGANTYPLYSIDKVYKDGVLLTLGVDYNVNLTYGYFTLTAAPGTSVITCEARGIIMDWINGTYNDSILLHAWLKFIYVDLNGISKDKINWASLKKIYELRKLFCGWWFGEEIDTNQFVNMLKRTGIFQVINLPSGEYFFRALESAIPSDVRHFYNEDFKNFNLIEDIDQCYKSIEIFHSKDPTTGNFKIRIKSDTRAEWQQGSVRTYSMETALASEFQSDDVAQNLLDMLKKPMQIISGSLPLEALLLNPTDKIYISKSIIDEGGNTIALFSNQAFIIIEIVKNISECRAEIKAIKNVSELFWTIT